MSVYLRCKKDLEAAAKELKRDYPTDLPAQREGINNHLDALCRANDVTLTKRQQDWLANYACQLHPK